MIERLDAIAKHYEDLNNELQDPDTLKDIEKTKKLSKELSSLEETVTTYQVYKKVLNNIEEAKEMLKDEEMKELASEELKNGEEQKEELEKKLEILLIPKDPNDDKNVVMEIRGAAGGDEANIFAGDLFRMYTRYAEK